MSISPAAPLSLIAVAAFLAPPVVSAQPVATQQKASATTPAQAAAGVLSRTFGEDVAARITFQPLQIQAGDNDTYEYEAKGGKLTVRGSSAIAMTRGAYDYIKAAKLGMVTRSGSYLDKSKPWPDSAPVRFTTPFKFRHHYNVVSFGYQTPYYDRATWERELDWLALHGYDMPMAPVATEAIAERMWKKMGLTQAEMNDFTVGPAHLPWFRMGNIRNVDAPLPPEWHADQLKLQHFLLGRMRELGMTPIIQSFAGFVPDAIKRLDPSVVLHDTAWNGGFGKDRRPRFITPDSPLFAKATRLFMQEWRAEFGDAKYWLVDSFNEMELPKTGKSPAEMLAGYSKDIYAAIAAGGTDAVWVIQGWMFGYQRHIWNKDTVKALLSGVPDDKMLILDYANDYARNWPEFSSFHGKPWIYGFVPNMGGKVAYTGKLDFYAKGAAETLAQPNRGNLVGFCASGEGMENNEALYELLSDTAWTDGAVKLDSWLRSYSEAKYGACPPEIIEAWTLLRKSAYNKLHAHPTFGWQNIRPGHASGNHEPDFFRAAQKFLAAGPALKKSPLYRADALEITALALGGKAEDWYALADRALTVGDIATADKAMARATQILLEADRLLESHPLHTLRRWTDLARSHGDTPALKAYYESNARRIVTTWGPPVNDYACKVWSGLIRDFYAPRMQAWYDGKKSGKGFQRGPWEESWVKSTAGISRIAPYSDPVAAAAECLTRAATETMPVVAEPKYESLAEWSPAQVTTKWTGVDFPILAEQAKKLKGVRFRYTGGNHALEIQKVILVADGREVATDAHPGTAGDPPNREIYRIKLPKDATVNNGAALRVTLRGKGGNDSRGTVEIFAE